MAFSHNTFFMSFIKIYLHFVWATKNRVPYLSSKSIRDDVWDHIHLNSKIKEIHTLYVGGHKDHCHCLVSLSKDQTISKIAQLLKGESSFWINKSGLIKDQFQDLKFDWQDEYYVESVSYSGLSNVINYISHQEEHHLVHSFEEEYEKLMIEINEQNLGG